MSKYNKVSSLRKIFKVNKIDGFIQPSNDEYLGEYVPDHYKRLEWLTDFNGSAGLAVVLKRKAAFFTDGRYTLQAKHQLNDQSFKIFNTASHTPEVWLSMIIGDDDVIGFDPLLHTEAQIKRYTDADIKMKPVDSNPIDSVWNDRPEANIKPIELHYMDYAGQTSLSKREMLSDKLKANNVDTIIITAPDSICWLLNIRGADVPYAPLVHATLIHNATGETLLFIDSRKLSKEVIDKLGKVVILIDTYQSDDNPIQTYFRNCRDIDHSFQVDPSSTPYWYVLELEKHDLHVVRAEDPCQLMKACKNPIELEGMENAHLRDGVAIIRFLQWLDKNTTAGKDVTEMSAASQLEEFRKDGDLYQGMSFETISGYGANGAIIHYRTTEETNKKLEKGSLYLCDSGGQYLDGTTDVTRTIAIGKPKDEHKRDFTLVLKGHLALGTISFPEGTAGAQLDVLARQYLWNQGLDYDHGTGHGVGSYLSVHEGPQSVSKYNKVPLQEGMILSNEPGFYKEGEYGIRIENLIAVLENPQKSTEQRKFYSFMPLTMVPIDKNLIDVSLMSESEINALNSYHEIVCEEISPMLEDEKDVLKWLEKACSPLKKKPAARKKPAAKKDAKATPKVTKSKEPEQEESIVEQSKNTSSDDGDKDTETSVA